MVTGEERAETIAFIDAIMATPCMRYAHKYLAAKGQAPESETGFKVCVCLSVCLCARARACACVCVFIDIFSPISRSRFFCCLVSVAVFFCLKGHRNDYAPPGGICERCFLGCLDGQPISVPDFVLCAVNGERWTGCVKCGKYCRDGRDRIFL